jgi:signal transduction histidine kinase
MLKLRDNKDCLLSEKLYKRFAVAFVLMLLLGSFICTGHRFMPPESSSPQAVHGLIDLSGWDWEEDGTVLLNGEWSFYWNELQLTGNAEQTERSAQYLKVPGSWNGAVPDGKPLPGQGYATYRLKVLLPEQENVLALHLPPINTSYSLWINGKRVAAAGQAGTSAAETVPLYAPQIAVVHTQVPEMEIVCEVANYDHQKGGIRQPIEFGPVSQIVRSGELSAGFDTLLIGSLLIMGLYHLGLYAVRTKEVAMLYFSLFCLLFSLRISLLGEIIATKAIPGFRWTLELKLEYLTSAVCLTLFVLFFASLYRDESYRPLNLGFCIAGALYSIMIAVLPPLIFTEALLYLQLFVASGILYILIVVLLAYIRKREGAGILLFSCFVFAVTIVNDMLYAHELVSTTDKMSAFGLLIFIFSQSVVLSIKLSRAYYNEEKLSAELSEMNSGLYGKIKERTSDLEQSNEALIRSNDELSRLEKSRSHLLSNISHDLGTPLTAIQCYLEAILDNMADTEEQKERYLRLIHSKVIGMERLIEDLFQLSQLEARQVAFRLQPVTTNRLIELLFTRYELDTRGAGIDYTLSISGEAAEKDAFSTVKVDLERLHQVYSNLIFNAIKFTPKGGSISVEMSDDGQQMLVRICDTGDGIRLEDLPYIFDRFYTNHKALGAAGGGKGLGLSISKEIVEYHGGRIWVETTGEQKGTVICFTIPVQSS